MPVRRGREEEGRGGRGREDASVRSRIRNDRRARAAAEIEANGCAFQRAMRGIEDGGRRARRRAIRKRARGGRRLRGEEGVPTYWRERTGDYHVVIVVASSSLRGAYLAIDGDLLNVRLRLHRSSFILAAVQQLHHLDVHHGSRAHPKFGARGEHWRNRTANPRRVRCSSPQTLIPLEKSRRRRSICRVGRRVFFLSIGERERDAVTSLSRRAKRLRRT